MGIDFTFDAERHLYIVQGGPVPSVTQVLHSAGLSADYSMVAADVLERKRIILVSRINGMLCGGTIDRAGSMAGKLWIIDLKCIERLYPAFALQTAGYELLLPKPMVPPFKYDRAVLQLRRDGSYKLTAYRNPTDLDVFRASLVVTAWKMNQGMDIQAGARTDLDEAA